MPRLHNGGRSAQWLRSKGPDPPRAPRAVDPMDPMDPALGWTSPGDQTGEMRLPRAGPRGACPWPGPGADFGAGGTQGPAGPRGGERAPRRCRACAPGAPGVLGAWETREGRYCYTVTSLINMLLTLSLSFLGS